MRGWRQESVANGFNQLNQSPNVVSSAYTSATKSEERKRSGEGEKIEGHSAGILSALVLSRHILILVLSLQLEPKTHLHSDAD